MTRTTLALGLLLTPSLALAQDEIPATKRSWGQSPDGVESAILSAPGWRLVDRQQDGVALLIAFQSVDGTHERLVYAFLSDSLICITRELPLGYQKDIAPNHDWKPGRPNEWTIPAENVWIKRYYDGVYIRDVFRPIPSTTPEKESAPPRGAWKIKKT